MVSLFNFIKSDASVNQPNNKSFGVENTHIFRITSRFDISADTPAYAILSGTILLQQQATDPDKVNLILKPDNLKEIKLPIKYIIYRGLKIGDFLINNNLLDNDNKVKNTDNDSELLDIIHSIQETRTAPSTEDIPVSALFGYDLDPDPTKPLQDFFFTNTSPNSQLFSVYGGIELGNFASGEIGIDIILENPEYEPTVEMAQEAFYEIDVTNASNPKYDKEQIRHFIDPVAFYGLHHDIKGGIEYRDANGTDQTQSLQEVYEKIQAPFATKNNVYLDIRNENGYSYNYYDNYDTKELNIGQIPASLAPTDYYNQGWPLHIVSLTASNSQDENKFSLALRINDNKRPLMTVWNASLDKDNALGELNYNVADPPLTIVFLNIM